MPLDPSRTRLLSSWLVLTGGVRLAIGTTKNWIREGRGKGGEDPETPERGRGGGG